MTGPALGSTWTRHPVCVVDGRTFLEGHHSERKPVFLTLYQFHQQARNLSPRTIKASGEYLRPFLALHDPLRCSQNDLLGYLADMNDSMPTLDGSDRLEAPEGLLRLADVRR